MPNAEMTRAMVHYTAEAEARMARTEAETARLSARLEETREGHAACAGELEATRATLGTVKQTLEATADELEREMGARAIADGELASACAGGPGPAALAEEYGAPLLIVGGVAAAFFAGVGGFGRGGVCALSALSSDSSSA